MTTDDLKLIRLERIENHRWIRAVAEVSLGGLYLRGLKLEHHPEGWRLTPPGRKLNGSWQTLFNFQDRELEKRLLELLLNRHG